MNLTALIQAVHVMGEFPATTTWDRLGATIADQRTDLAVSLMRHIDDAANAEFIGSSARETATHYVWPVCRQPDSTSRIFVNEFKDNSPANASYATSVHNHRYDFVTIPLAGSYEYETYTEVTASSRASGGLNRIAHGRLMPGQWLFIDHREYHRLSEVAPHTLTLVVKSAPHRQSSYSVHLATGARTEHVPVELRIPELQRRLKVVGYDRRSDPFASRPVEI